MVKHTVVFHLSYFIQSGSKGKQILAMCFKQILETSLSLSPNALLWYNPRLGEFFKLEDGHKWAQYGIKYLHQLYVADTFKYFEQLQDKQGIPNSWHF